MPPLSIKAKRRVFSVNEAHRRRVISTEVTFYTARSASATTVHYTVAMVSKAQIAVFCVMQCICAALAAVSSDRRQLGGAPREHINTFPYSVRESNGKLQDKVVP
ncbi:hypothetical protein V7S43_018000 [Phytophthora oleae]|uniref:Uncharacterized protein n=1 Tax=Phytophthora oleae TaxID=2107226 RepID=A0ABD3ERZ7_9STRA